MTERHLQVTKQVHGAISIVLVLGSLFFKQPSLTLSVILGIFIVRANFWLLEYMVMGMLKRNSSKGRLVLAFVSKYLILMAILAGVIIYFDCHLLGLLIGVSSLVVAILLVAVKEGLQVG